MFCEIFGPLSHAAYTERSTIVDLLIKIPGPLNPAAYRKVHNFFKRSEICFKKRSKISNAPAWKFDKKISLDSFQVLIQDTNLDAACTILQDEFLNFSKWCEINQLTINTKKTKSMLFTTSHHTNRAFLPNLKLKDSKIEHVGNFSYLGVKLDSYLNFNFHLQEIVRLVAHKIHLLSMMRSYISKTQALSFYKTNILPYADYGDVLYIIIVRITYLINHKDCKTEH